MPAFSLGFRDVIDLPEFRPEAVSPNASASGVGICSDMRPSADRLPFIWQLASATVLNVYNAANDGWTPLASPALAGVFGAGACCVVAPSRGPRGSINVAGSTASAIALSTALPGSVGINQLANRGDGVKGFKIRIINPVNGLTVERYIVGNTGGTTTPTIYLDSPLGGTPGAGSLYEILSPRVYLLGSGTTAAGSWKALDVATNTYLTLANSGLPVTISSDSALISLDAQHCASPGLGLINNGAAITATGSSSTTLTGSVNAALDSQVTANEYRNFTIRIVNDTGTPAAVGQRRRITSHTAGTPGSAAPVYTVSAWTTTPSTNAQFVIEHNDDILLFTSAVATVYAYTPDTVAGGQTGDTWSTAVYAARSTAVGAGVTAFTPFGMTIDAARNARHSFIFSFRGGASNALDVLDIAAAATGTWNNGAGYGNTGPTFTTGTCACYDPCVTANSYSPGAYAYLNANGGQTFYRFDCKNRVLEGWAPLRYAAGAAVVGSRMATVTAFDSSTGELGIPTILLASTTNLFGVVAQR